MVFGEHAQGDTLTGCQRAGSLCVNIILMEHFANPAGGGEATGHQGSAQAYSRADERWHGRTVEVGVSYKTWSPGYTA